MRVLGSLTVTSVFATQLLNDSFNEIKSKNPECSSPEESSVEFSKFLKFFKNQRLWFKVYEWKPSQACEIDCQTTNLECIMDCGTDFDCQGGCSRDFFACLEICPCYTELWFEFDL